MFDQEEGSLEVKIRTGGGGFKTMVQSCGGLLRFVFGLQQLCLQKEEVAFLPIQWYTREFGQCSVSARCAKHRNSEIKKRIGSGRLNGQDLFK